MLRELSVKNVALIDELKLPFGPRLNVLTGETGAGKSILVESINFALGGRIKKDMLRSGAATGFVELLFYAPGDEMTTCLQALGIEPEPDGSLLIARSLSREGRTVSRVNGRTVTLTMLRQVTAPLIDIHGQHEHQSLLEPSAHRELLDLFSDPEQLQRLQLQVQAWRKLTDLRREMENLAMDERERERRADLLRFQVQEIDGAGLCEEEEEELESRRRRLQGAEKIRETLREVLWLLTDGDSEGMPPAADAVRKAATALSTLEGIDDGLDQLAERLVEVSSQLDDLGRDLRSEWETGEFDTSDLNQIEGRLAQYFSMKRKYGDDLQAVQVWRDEAAEELAGLEGADQRLAVLEKERREQENLMQERCRLIHQWRCQQGEELSSQVVQVLKDLAMASVEFNVAVEKIEAAEHGADQVEFMIAPNRGESLKPLRKIASGGEMSRIMLALKSVLAEKDRVASLLFDEIDAGVSGRAAQKVAEHLARVSGTRQVICVTHLPQIAAMADDHFRIEKRERQGRTFTTVGPLPAAESLAELARLLSGAKLTEAATENARQLKSQAESERAVLREKPGNSEIRSPKSTGEKKSRGMNKN